jgi:transposase InsO family protein
MTSDEESDADEPVTRVMSMQTTTAMGDAISNRNARRMRAGPKVVLDLGCGHCSMAMYYLEQDAQIYVIAVDNGLEKDEALRYIPAHMQHRVWYVKEDVTGMTLKRIQEMMRKAFGLDMQHLYHVHFSPDCSTYSTANHTHTRHNDDGSTTTIHTYRNQDGTVNTDAPAHMQKKARRQDMVLRDVLHNMSVLAQRYPDVLQTVENPQGYMIDQPCVQELLRQDTRWRLLTGDYCKSADIALDGDIIWTKKRTNFVIRAVPADFQLPLCDNDCNYRFPEGSGKEDRHLRAIRIDAKSCPGQEKQEGPLRHRIPKGLIDKIHKAHKQYKTQQFNAQVHEILETCHECTIPCDGMMMTMEKKKNKGKRKVVEPPAVAKDTTTDDDIYENDTTQAQDARETTKENAERQRKTLRAKVTDVNIARLQALWTLWHARYGHASVKRMRIPTELQGMMKYIDKTCKTCSAAKACRKPHKGKLKRAAYAMRRVHTDIQGPFRTPDLDGNLYQVTFIDCWSRRKWVYLMRDKAQFGRTFMTFLAEVGVNPEAIRSDNAGEYTAGANCNQFLQICMERAIDPEKSIPYSPQMNSVAERAMRTLLNMARSLLHNAGLGHEYWGYAFRHAAWLDERLKSVETGKTPYEMWHGHEHDDTKLITFGARLTYRHRDQDRSIDPKLDMPGREGIFLGYDRVTGGSWVQDITSEKRNVQVTKDIEKQSIDESHIIITEPNALTQEQWALLQSELDDVTQTDSQEVTDHEPMINTDIIQTPTDQLKYWKAKQMYTKDRRQQLLRTEQYTPAQVEEMISMEWTIKTHGQARRAQQAREARTTTEAAREVAEDNDLRMPPTTHSATAPEPSKKKMKQEMDIAQVPCPKCKSPRSTRKNDIILCDQCDRGYHQACIKMVKLPLPSDSWYCYGCLKVGDRVSVLWSDGLWHDGLITMKYGEEIGVDIAYDTGQREQTNLYTVRWRPLFEREPDLVQFVHALNLWNDEDTGEMTQRTVYQIDEQAPRSHADIINKLPPHLRQLWLMSEEKEWSGIVRKGAVKLVPNKEVPKGALIVPCKWHYVIKHDGTRKSRICVLGNKIPRTHTDAKVLGKRTHAQIRAEELQAEAEAALSAPTPRLSTVRMLFDVAAKEGLCLDSMDCDQAFMNSAPNKTIYLHLPPGLQEEKTHKALMLLNVYGCREGPALWAVMLDNWFKTNGWKPNPHDPCLYQKIGPSGRMNYVCCHVDDLGICGTRTDVDYFKAELRKSFQATDGGPMGQDTEGNMKTTRFLGLEAERHPDGSFTIHQKTLIDNLLKRAAVHMTNIGNADTPMSAKRLDRSTLPTDKAEKEKQAKRPLRSLLGCVGYIMLGSRPDCAAAYTQLARFNNEHGEEHWLALQQLIAYLRKTRDTHVLKVDSHGSQIIQTFVDADWNGTELSRSTTGFIVFSGRTPISWCSKTQKAVARSTMEAELIAYSSATQETVFIAMLARAMRMKHADQTEVIINKEKPTPTPGEHNGAYYAAEVWSDSQNALACVREPEGWIRNKVRHVRTAWFWFKQYVQSREIIPRFCRGMEQCADILTKGMGTAKGGQESKTSQAALLFQRHARFCLGHPPETSRPTTAASARSNKPERAESKKRKMEAASAYSMQVAGEGDDDED